MSELWQYEPVTDHPRDALNAVVVDTRCPTCSRFCSPKGTVVFYLGDEGVDRFEGWACKRCGPFQPQIVGWAGDFA